MKRKAAHLKRERLKRDKAATVKPDKQRWPYRKKKLIEFYEGAPPIITGEQITMVDEDGNLQRPFVLQINPAFREWEKRKGKG